MGRRTRVMMVVGVLALSLVGCATPGAGEQAAEPTPTASATAEKPDISPDVADGEDPEAVQRAEAWLAAANLPPGAVAVDKRPVAFGSWIGWPCTPVEMRSGFWTVPAITVTTAANWLAANPTADLVTTAVGRPQAEDPAITNAMVGYIPEPGAQEGVVYTVTKLDDGVAIRAEVAARTADSECEVLPDGGQWGAPGQG